MRKVISILLSIVVLLVPMLASAEAETHSAVTDLPMAGQVAHCNSHDITITKGTMRIISHWTVDANDRIHLHTTWNVSGAKGMDQYGNKYVFVSAHPYLDSNTAADFSGDTIVISDANHAQFIGRGSAPNFDMSWSVHRTFNHHGELVSYHWSSNIECWH